MRNAQLPVQQLRQPRVAPGDENVTSRFVGLDGGKNRSGLFVKGFKKQCWRDDLFAHVSAVAIQAGDKRPWRRASTYALLSAEERGCCRELLSFLLCFGC